MALSRRSGFGTCANKLKRPLDFDTSLFQNGDGGHNAVQQISTDLSSIFAVFG